MTMEMPKSDFYESKFKFIAVTNKKTDNKSVIYHISPSEIDKKSIISNVGIYIAPNNKSESFGITILEAINHGNVAICSNIQAFKTLLNDSGIFFDKDNFEDLKKTINNLNEENLNEIWSKQYNYISQNYSMDKVLQKWIYVYKNI